MSATKRKADAARRVMIDDKRRRSQPLSRSGVALVCARAHNVAQDAADLRASLRRKTDPKNGERISALRRQLDALHACADELRPELARLPRDPQREEAYGAQLRAAAAALQPERRKLWKMLNPR